MKKHLHNSLRALFLSLAVLLSLPMLAVGVEIDGINYDLVVKAKQATVIGSGGNYSGEVVIPESVEHEGTAYSVTSIGGYAFHYCEGLTSVTIPNSVTSIGYNAFYGCYGLTSVHISDIAAWCNIDFDGDDSNPLYRANHLYLNGEEVKDLVIPNSVTSIGSHAFYYCSGLTSVTIPNSVTSIGSYAFSGCSGLTSVIIGNSVKYIYNNAFSDCPELLDVYCYAEKVPSTYSDAFDGSYPEYVTLHVPDASVASYKATAPWSSFGKIVGLSGEEIPQEYSLKVSHVGYATLFLDFNAEIPANVKAYVAARVEGNRLKMERVEGVLPANTGVIVLANEGTYTFAESEATPATIDDNLLEGTVVTTQISADPSYSYYVLSNVEGVVAMYLAKLTDGKFQNNANKAYMKVNKGDLGVFDEEVDSSVEQLSRKFVFDFDDTTGITETEIGNVKSENSAIFDLSGRRVQKAQKGIFIQNGKVVVK